jgi:hypothetical protein
MRLRQIALAAHDLDAVTGALDRVFGLKVAYNDPGIHHYGLKNAVLPAGAAFLEVVQPIAPDASAGRFLARRGGDAGYMVIIQAPDALEERTRLAGMGVRVVDDIDRPDYRAAHFHPADFGGMLVSIDQQRTEPDYLVPDGDWWPAGPDWRETPASEVLDVLGITLEAADPVALADLWSRLLATPLDVLDPSCLSMARGEVRFAQGDRPTTSIGTIHLRVANARAALDRARAEGLDIADGGILIGGVRFRPVG